MRTVLILLLAALLGFNGCIVYYPSPDNSATVTFQPIPSQNQDVFLKPFQVLYSESCYHKGRLRTVNQFDLLSKNDLIEVDEDGYLILVHFSGAFFEFDNQTEFSVAQLAERIDRTHKTDYSQTNGRASFDVLFLESSPFNNYRVTGIPARPVQRPIKFLLPDQFGISPVNPTFCLKWIDEQPNNSGTYTVRIRDILDEVIDEFEVIGKDFFIDLTELSKQQHLFLLSVQDTGTMESSHEVGVIVGSMNEFIPHECVAGSAVKALEMAYFLERNSFSYWARPYYEQAADVSDRQIFDELLRKYHLRYSGN